VGENFVLDDGGVLVNEDVFDCEGGDLGEEYAAECVCDRGIDACERERSVVGAVGVELDIEVLVSLLDCALWGNISRNHVLIGESAHTFLK
jgi:hypothetical protein